MSRKATHLVREEVIRILDEDQCLLAEIHIGRFTPNKFSVFLGSVELFITDMQIKPVETDSLEEALALLEPWFPKAGITAFLKDHPGLQRRVNHYPINGA